MSDHLPRNINHVHHAEVQASLNQRLAILVTRVVGAMPTAYLFAALAVVGLVAILGVFPALLATLVSWLSQTFIQLTLLPIIMVGQAVISRKQELLADEQFATTQKTYRDAEHMRKELDGIRAHLDLQDARLAQINLDLIDAHKDLLTLSETVQKPRGKAVRKSEKIVQIYEDEQGGDA